MLPHVEAAAGAWREDDVWVCHELQVVLKECPSIAVRIIVVVSLTGVAASELLPPVGHAVLVGVPVVGAVLLGIVLPALAGSMLGDVFLGVYLSFESRL